MASCQPTVERQRLHQTTQGLALIDPDLCVAEADRVFCELAGDGASLSGRPVHALLPGVSPHLGALVEAALAGRRPVRDLALEEQGGARRWQVSLYPVLSRVGRVLGVDVILCVPDGASALGTRPGAAVAVSRSDGPFRTIFEHADIGIVLIGPDGALVAANPGFCAIVGYSYAELRQLRPQDITHPDDQRLDREQLARLARGETPAPIEKRYRHKDGGLVWARVSRSLVRDDAGEVQFGIILVQNISEARRAAEAERAARAGAEEALRLRDAFITVAAHELRTPLTALLGQARLLQRRLAGAGLSEANRRSLEAILSQSQRLKVLIADMLDGARLEAGQLTLRRARLELGALLRRVAEELQPSLLHHELRYSLADEPLIVEGDALRLEQALQNLLSNAVKYSPRGSLITLRASRKDGHALVSVRDEGIGIPPEALPRLFERFYRAPNADTEHVGGAGVGLYVAREIVTQHGGRIAVESAPGGGSTFTIALPLQADGDLAGGA